jgi:hypothetical protein
MLYSVDGWDCGPDVATTLSQFLKCDVRLVQQVCFVLRSVFFSIHMLLQVQQRNIVLEGWMFLLFATR